MYVVIYQMITVILILKLRFILELVNVFMFGKHETWKYIIVLSINVGTAVPLYVQQRTSIAIIIVEFSLVEFPFFEYMCKAMNCLWI